MRPASGCRALLAAGSLGLGGCAGGLTDGLTDASRLAQAHQGLHIEGFPKDQRLHEGESVLLSIPDVPDQVETIRWLSSDPRVLSLLATPEPSPCGSACAWLRGESAGEARVEARLCFVDGSCLSLDRARVCGEGGTREIETVLAVVR